VRTPGVARKLARTLLVLLAAIVVCMFLPWQQNIRAKGNIIPLMPEERPQSIPATIGGRISKWHVREGQQVQAGDTLIELTEVKEKYFDPQMVQRLEQQLVAKQQGIEAAEGKLEALSRQVNALKKGYEASIGKGRNKIRQTYLKVATDSADLVAAANANQVAIAQLARQQKLFDQGLKSLTELEARRLKQQETQAKWISAENKLNVSRNELINARIELNSIQAEYLDKISKTESEMGSAEGYVADATGQLSKLNIEVSSTKVRAGYYIVRAPRSGYVTRTLKAGIGSIIKEGESIAVIVPAFPKLAAEVFVRPMDVPLLKLNNAVRLEFDGWPAMQFSGWPSVSVGTFAGRVNAIDYVNSPDGTYRVLVTPDPNQEPWPKELRTGGGVNSWALLRTVSVGYEIWRQLNGFQASLPSKPSAEKANEKGKVVKDSKSENDKDDEDK